MRIGTLMSSLFNANGTMEAGAIGYDITASRRLRSPIHLRCQRQPGQQDRCAGPRNLLHLQRARPEGHHDRADSRRHHAAAPPPPTPTTPSATSRRPRRRWAASPARTYDGNGNKVSDTDARGNITTYQYDALNRLIAHHLSRPTTTTQDLRLPQQRRHRDRPGRPRHAAPVRSGWAADPVTQAYGTANATTTSYTYDNAGRKTTETDALSHTTTYTYDAAGNLTAISGVKGNFTYAYDNARNRSRRPTATATPPSTNTTPASG